MTGDDIDLSDNLHTSTTELVKMRATIAEDIH